MAHTFLVVLAIKSSLYYAPRIDVTFKRKDAPPEHRRLKWGVLKFFRLLEMASALASPVQCRAVGVPEVDSAITAYQP